MPVVFCIPNVSRIAGASSVAIGMLVETCVLSVVDVLFDEIRVDKITADACTLDSVRRLPFQNIFLLLLWNRNQN